MSEDWYTHGDFRLAERLLQGDVDRRGRLVYLKGKEEKAARKALARILRVRKPLASRELREHLANLFDPHAPDPRWPRLYPQRTLLFSQPRPAHPLRPMFLRLWVDKQVKTGAARSRKEAKGQAEKEFGLKKRQIETILAAEGKRYKDK
jgi:hypothetical protein